MRLIDADAVKDVIAELNENGYDISPSDLAFVRNILLRMPTIEPVKHGKWEMSRSEYGNIALIKCSECHFEYPMLLAHMFRYCPNCGADMMERSNDGKT